MPLRAMHYNRDTNYYEPESLEDLISHLDRAQPQFCLVYLHASWNPVIKHMERDYVKTCGKFGNYMHIKVDCDKHVRIKQYFDTRIEPQFLILQKGHLMQRITGYNFSLIYDFMEKVTE